MTTPRLGVNIDHLSTKTSGPRAQAHARGVMGETEL